MSKVPDESTETIKASGYRIVTVVLFVLFAIFMMPFFYLGAAITSFAIRHTIEAPHVLLLHNASASSDSEHIDPVPFKSWRLVIPYTYNVTYLRYGTFLDRYVTAVIWPNGAYGSRFFGIDYGKDSLVDDFVGVIANIDPKTNTVTAVRRMQDPTLAQFSFTFHNDSDMETYQDDACIPKIHGRTNDISKPRTC